MVAPATVQIAQEFGEKNPPIIAMMTTFFVLGYGEQLCDLTTVKFICLLVAFGPLVSSWCNLLVRVRAIDEIQIPIVHDSFSDH